MSSNWTEQRPWGRFLNLFESENCKVKLIEVDAGKRLSYQNHQRRREAWTVIQGEAVVILNDQKYHLKTGEHIDIPLQAKHRLSNEGSQPLQIIEVQTGTYFGEDDIQRFEDDWGR